MKIDYLHNHKDFISLLSILESETGIDASLIEKDYWIMQVLHGLKKLGHDFELKGGTSLSKGFKIIDRFSEDIDIHIKPPKKFGINENPKNIKTKNIAARKDFYNWLSQSIQIDGIISIARDLTFDDKDYYRSGGIRLFYESKTSNLKGVKEGILLEVGFDNVTPNQKINISSWAFEKAQEANIEFIDNRAFDVNCYDIGYTFIEKLQTIATKFRQEHHEEGERPNFMRQYYDVYCLIDQPEVQKFIGSQEYEAHKQKRFPTQDLEIPIAKQEAFLLNDRILRAKFRKRYEDTKSLYYKGQPDFEEVLKRIKNSIHKL
jgi:hypothetical protein